MFWAGLVVGRVIAIPLSMRLSPRSMIQLDLAVGLGAIGLIGLLPESEVALWTGTIVFGMAIASIFASCVNFASERIPIASHVMAIFFIGGSLGAMTLPWLIGQYFDSTGPEVMIWVVGTTMAAGLLVFGAIRRHVTRRVPVVPE
jgi:FHS family Na+ dependent glucose MFS transporter 1